MTKPGKRDGELGFTLVLSAIFFCVWVGFAFLLWGLLSTSYLVGKNAGTVGAVWGVVAVMVTAWWVYGFARGYAKWRRIRRLG